MRKAAVVKILFVLLGLFILSAAYFRYPDDAQSILAFELALLMTFSVFAIFYRTFSQKSAKHIHEERAKESLMQASRFSGAWREARSKIPKNSPRRESGVVSNGMNRLSAVRSMAVLLRSASLRSRVMEICDLGDSVLETIRRMPNDTPAAVAFADKHLASLYDTLESRFKKDGAKDKKERDNNQNESEAEEMECFNIFITLFAKQQDSILSEGRALKT